MPNAMAGSSMVESVTVRSVNQYAPPSIRDGICVHRNLAFQHVLHAYVTGAVVPSLGMNGYVQYISGLCFRQ